MKKKITPAAPLLFTVSGLRGIAGKSLTLKVAAEYASAFAGLTRKGKIVLARDTRASGQAIKAAVAAVLVSSGCEVIDIGIAPTPTVGLAVTDLKAGGAITVTASHNPIEWNALKFFNRRGRYLSPGEIGKISKLLNQNRPTGGAGLNWGKVKTDGGRISAHIRRIMRLNLVQKEKIRRAKFKVVIDGCNGAGYIAGPELLKALGCKIIKINCRNTGSFPRKPEPTVKNLKALEKKVRQVGADIGFALDPDADRLAIVSDKGKAIGEEYTLALATDYVLGKSKGPVAVNLSTSRMVEEIAQKHKCKFYRTRVGEANVSAQLEKVKGIIGGEGNGGVILPRLHYTRDALLGMALILSHLAQSKKTISELVDKIPKYSMI
ncbi:MAG: phosphoglucosamine mutase, partial [candidate division Zixibacteria bacterium]|nr:phosphoglucosamine mutase [candidate division Zixibacteria bacterium]